jgi:D-beta-D-heptose 7-phosphate kinase/D-beta-D-heptose 1-phosphate adenosyltransferase
MRDTPADPPAPPDLAALAHARVLVLGDVALDRHVFGTVARVSPEAPVPVLAIEREAVAPGCAANVAAGIAALGARAMLVGVVGEDDAARTLRATLAAAAPGVALWAIDAADGRPTTVKTRWLAAGGQHLMRSDLEVARPVDRETESCLLAVVRLALPQCDAMTISDYGKGVLTDRVLASVIALARDAGKPVLVDPKRADFAAYRGVDLVKPNRAELAAATGIACDTAHTIAAAATMAIAATGAAVLVTRGPDGLSLYRSGCDPVHARDRARPVADVAGAGDTVMAVIAAALAAGMAVEHALPLANLAAGIAVGRPGTAVVTAADLAEVSSGCRAAPVACSALAAVMQREAWRRAGLRVGLANGCFDLLHPGHLALIAQARAACDRLIVAVNSDASVCRLKGAGRPIQTQEARCAVLAALADVDLVVLFGEDTPLALIDTLRPDLLVKGADYADDEIVGAREVRAWGGEVLRASLAAGQSTTALVRRAVRTEAA